MDTYHLILPFKSLSNISVIAPNAILGLLPEAYPASNPCSKDSCIATALVLAVASTITTNITREPNCAHSLAAQTKVKLAPRGCFGLVTPIMTTAPYPPRSVMSSTPPRGSRIYTMITAVRKGFSLSEVTAVVTASYERLRYKSPRRRVRMTPRITKHGVVIPHMWRGKRNMTLRIGFSSCCTGLVNTTSFMPRCVRYCLISNIEILGPMLSP